MICLNFIYLNIKYPHNKPFSYLFLSILTFYVSKYISTKCPFKITTTLIYEF